MEKPEIQTILIPDGGLFPNNDVLPLTLLQQVFDPKTENLAQAIEKTFHENAWEGSWRNGVYDFHHYHSTAHEVLGLYAGRVKVRFGGPDGQAVAANAGDVIIIPAGVSLNRRISAVSAPIRQGSHRICNTANPASGPR
ncbi:MAG: hypothetical protein P8X90_31825 [Desulfobacterales bacterium]